MKQFTSYLFIFITLFLLLACENEKRDSDVAHDPNSPIVGYSFTPESGGLATKVILTGENFGSDPNLIEVLFNDKTAKIIGCSNTRILAVIPRKSGDECVVKINIGNQSFTYEKKFIYETSITVSTIVGYPGTSTFRGGAFSEATFDCPGYITLDDEGNIYMSQVMHLLGWGSIITYVDMEKEVVSALTDPYNIPVGNPIMSPCLDPSGEFVLFPRRQGDEYYIIDKATLTTKKTFIIHPTPEEELAGKKDFTIDAKESFASCPLDGMIYTRAHHGELIRFDPVTRKGELVGTGFMPYSEAYIEFNPHEPNKLYLTYPQRHCIYVYDILNKAYKLFAGTLGVAGWKDGVKENALFNTPGKIVFDSDGNIFLGDTWNHCIRKISSDGLVSTVIGIPGKNGYQDGNPSIALFNGTQSIAIDKDNNIYIGDFWNKCIRKLSIE